ncbi:MAG: iron-containing alcohol dehydrogenase [Paracoccaceae bacterium]
MNDLDNFNFNTTPDIRFGSNILISSVAEIKKILGPRIFIISDPTLSKIGLYNTLVDHLKSKGIKIKIYDKIKEDPSIENLQSAIVEATIFLTTGILGFGGGSPMDVAKLTSLLLGSNDNIDEIWGVNKVEGPRLPLVLIPTTAGTGSEVTPISIITMSNKEKKGVSSKVIIPDLAIVDPILTLNLPSKTTASTGIDAMVHAIEAYTSKSKNNNIISKALAEKALKLIGDSIIQAVENGKNDIQARNKMLLGSLMAGISFANSPVAAIHALAYPLGGKYKITHGLSNALILPYVIKFNMKDKETRNSYLYLSDIIFPKLSNIKNKKNKTVAFVNEFIDLSKRFNLPTKIRELGIPKKACKEMSVEAMKQERLLINNPINITGDDAHKIYEEAW